MVKACSIVVGYHQGGDPLFLEEGPGQLQDPRAGLGVQGGGVLVQEGQLRLQQGGHQHGEGLALAAGEQLHLGA